MPNTKSLDSVSRSQKAKPEATLYWGFTCSVRMEEGDVEFVEYAAVYEFQCSETSKMPSALTKILEGQESAFMKTGPKWKEYSGHELLNQYDSEKVQVRNSIKGFETELKTHVELTTSEVGTSNWPGGSKAWVLLGLTKKRKHKTDDWETDEWETAFNRSRSRGSNTSSYEEHNLS